MSITIQETFQVQAPIDRVWEYLTDPRQVVTCLPGAELVSVEDPTRFRGRVKVKVGPVTAAYDGTVTMLERDDAAHVVRMVGEGRESSGSGGGGGSAKLIMTSTLVSIPDGATEVRVLAELDVVGKLAQYGRGMIESVNKQLFKQFTTCVRETLELPVTHSSPTLPPPAADQSSAVMPSAMSVATASSSTAYAPPGPPLGAVAARPVRLSPLLLRALLERIRAVFRRRRR